MRRTLIAILTLFVGVAPLYATPAQADTVVGGPGLSGHGYLWDRSSGMSAPPHIQASSYVIADLETGRILAAKDPHGHYKPASTLKTLTAITLIPRLDPAKKMKPSQNAVNASGSAVGMDTKWTYTVSDLFHGLLMQSGNDAAIALTEANGGFKPSIDQMNAEAHRIQALDTVAQTPNGLDDDPPLTLAQQHSSAYDLALIMKQGLTLPDFRKYVGATLYDWPAPPDKKERAKGKKTGGYQIGTHDHLLVGNRYKGMIGGKNGWTSHALGSFVGAATRNGHTIIIALMHAQSDFWGDARSLLDWGFDERAKTGSVGTLVDPIPPPQPKKTVPAAAKRPQIVHVSPVDGPDWRKLGLAGGGGAALLAIVIGLTIVVRRRRRAAPAGAGAPPPPSGGHVRTFTPETAAPPGSDPPDTDGGADTDPGVPHPGDIKVAGAPPSFGGESPAARQTAPNPVQPVDGGRASDRRDDEARDDDEVRDGEDPAGWDDAERTVLDEDRTTAGDAERTAVDDAERTVLDAERTAVDGGRAVRDEDGDPGDAERTVREEDPAAGEAERTVLDADLGAGDAERSVQDGTSAVRAVAGDGAEAGVRPRGPFEPMDGPDTAPSRAVDDDSPDAGSRDDETAR
ncbi:D-alanyl-D-alanine carboxypeptidase family protein [Actinoallomurus acanthiterrae]